VATTDSLAAVPLCDIGLQYRTLQAEIDAAVLGVLRSGMAILGPETVQFEAEAARYCGTQFALGCGSGTDALLLALYALDIGPGDEVILPPFTFFATVGSIMRVGAKPVFVDIDPDTYNIDPKLVRQAISTRTKAIMPVHLFGQCADMAELQAIADEHKIHIIEDAAQSFGASYRGVRCGTLGVISCFSFYPSKNLGTLGDAGMVATNDPALHQKMAAYRVHGSEVKYYHKYIGWNARIDAIHAAILRVKLPHVDRWIEGRRAAAARYDHLLEATGLTTNLKRPTVRSDRFHTFNQYVVEVADGQRDRVLKALKAEQIGREVYYPLPLHQQECLRELGYQTGDFPISESAAKAVLALPMFPEITLTQQQRVVSALKGILQTKLSQAA